MKTSFLWSRTLFVIMLCLGTGTVLANGLIGDLINAVSPGTGTALDNIHREIKKNVPPYATIEEAGSKIINEASVQAGAPILRNLILASRDDALRTGVKSIPPDVRKNLTQFFSSDLLDRAKYGVRPGGDLTLQSNSIRYGDARAIVLDYVVVFKEQNDALFNVALWAHELQHVKQVRDWGLADFSLRYLRDYRSIEAEAEDVARKYVASVPKTLSNEQQTISNYNRPLRLLQQARYHQSSNICSTTRGRCTTAGIVPAGSACWCESNGKGSIGSTVPTVRTLRLHNSLPNKSSTCRFSNGPRAGQTQSYVGMVLPISIGSLCHDGQGSYGSAVADSVPNNSSTENQPLNSLSSTCKFTQGPRRGQVQSYLGQTVPVPLGTMCQDGISSWGIAVRDRESPAVIQSVQMQLSRTCRFNSGPRSGSSQTYGPEVTPVPIGSPCTDGQGSFGIAIGQGNSNSPPVQSALSSTCRFTQGPRAGQVQSYRGQVNPIPIGSPCQDGVGSYGTAISDESDDEEPNIPPDETGTEEYEES